MPELNKQGQEAQGEQIKITIDGEDSVDNSVEKPTGNISKKPEGSILDFPVPIKPKAEVDSGQESEMSSDVDRAIEEEYKKKEGIKQRLPLVYALKVGDRLVSDKRIREVVDISGPEDPYSREIIFEVTDRETGSLISKRETNLATYIAGKWEDLSGGSIDNNQEQEKQSEEAPAPPQTKEPETPPSPSEENLNSPKNEKRELKNIGAIANLRPGDKFKNYEGIEREIIGVKLIGNLPEEREFAIRETNTINGETTEKKISATELNDHWVEFSSESFIKSNSKSQNDKPPASPENSNEERKMTTTIYNSQDQSGTEKGKDSGLKNEELDAVSVPEYNQVAQERAPIVGANKKMDSADIEKQRERTKRILEEARSREAELDQQSDQKLESLKKQLDDFKSDFQEVKSLLKDLLEKKPEEKSTPNKNEEVENIDPSLAPRASHGSEGWYSREREDAEEKPPVENQDQAEVASPEVQGPPPLPERNQAETGPNTSLGDEFAKELQKQFESAESMGKWHQFFNWVDSGRIRKTLAAVVTSGGWKIFRAERFKAESEDWAGRVEKMVSFLNSEDGMYDKSLETLKNLGIETNSEIAENMAFQMYFGEKEKRERNKLIENEIVKKSLEKLESKLSGRANAEMIRADIEKRLRQRLEGVRKGNNEKAASDFAKIYRDGINKGWWKNYIWGSLGLAGGSLGVAGIHYLPWQTSAGESLDLISNENLSFSDSELSQSLEVNKTPVSDLNIDTGPVVGELDQPVLETLLEGGAPVEFTPEVAENFINNLKGTVWDDTKAFLMENHLPHDNQSVLEATKQVVMDSNELSRLSGGPEIAVPEWGIEGDIPDTRLKEGFSLDFNGLAEKFDLKKDLDLFDILSGKNPYQEFLEFDSETNLA